MKGAAPKNRKREGHERPGSDQFPPRRSNDKRSTSRRRFEPESRSVPGRASRNATPAYASASRITSLVVDSLAAAFTSILKFDGPSDVLLSRFFRLHPSLGQRDRGLIAEAVFFALRRYATLAWLMQPAHPARAARFAALLTLARQHRSRCDRSACVARRCEGGRARADNRSRTRARIGAVGAAGVAVCRGRAAVRRRGAADRRVERQRSARSACEFDQGIARGSPRRAGRASRREQRQRRTRPMRFGCRANRR